jgi:uncharacterized protein
MNYNNIVHESNFKEILKPIMRINGVKSSVLATMDGMPVGQMDRKGSIISATSAAVLGAVKEMVKNINFGMPEKLIVETDYGKIIIEEVGNTHVIVVLADDNANIGMIRITLKKVASKIQSLI